MIVQLEIHQKDFTSLLAFFESNSLQAVPSKSESDFALAFWRFINHELPALSPSLGSG